jgi:beta-N-acetylhexosaminidase
VSAACILGCEGPVLTPAEAAFFRDTDPWGFILFGRNVEAPDQVRALASALREAVGRADAPILVDQEGGRVQRLGPPHWGRYPSARTYAGLDPAVQAKVAWLGARLMAQDLAALGITVDCAPVLDVPDPDAHEVIGDRAYGDDPQTVAALGRAVAEGLMAGGVLPVLKHMPGHGRARVDSHRERPIVEASPDELSARDFGPFHALTDLPIAMTAHVVYAAVDPEQPATMSPAVIQEVIRGEIGFQGLLVSDDLSMAALGGGLGARAERAVAAGCDVVLYGEGDRAGMAAVAAGAGALAVEAAGRAAAALARIRPAEPFDAAAGRARFQAAFGGRWAA